MIPFACHQIEKGCYVGSVSNPVVHSINFSCLKCSNGNWYVFITVAFLPTTVLFLLVVIFSRSCNANVHHCLPLYSCHIMTSMSSVIGTLESLSVSKATTMPHMLIYGFGTWNLPPLPLVCLHGVTSGMAMLAVDTEQSA